VLCNYLDSPAGSLEKVKRLLEVSRTRLVTDVLPQFERASRRGRRTVVNLGFCGLKDIKTDFERPDCATMRILSCLEDDDTSCALLDLRKICLRTLRDGNCRPLTVEEGRRGVEAIAFELYLAKEVYDLELTVVVTISSDWTDKSSRTLLQMLFGLVPGLGDLPRYQMYSHIGHLGRSTLAGDERKNFATGTVRQLCQDMTFVLGRDDPELMYTKFLHESKLPLWPNGQLRDIDRWPVLKPISTLEKDRADEFRRLLGLSAPGVREIVQTPRSILQNLRTPRPVAQPVLENDDGTERRAIEPNAEAVRVDNGKKPICISCRKLKTRCNKELPCSQCDSEGRTCEYDQTP